jgi:hypothetical protein
VLVDPNAAAADGMHISLDWWQPSDDGGHVVYGVSRAGSEDSVIHVMETATGKVLPERIPRAQYASPSWLPDGSGFTYNQLSREGVSPSDPEYFLRGRCLLHRLGTDPRTDVFVLGQGYQDDVKVTDSEFPFIGTQPGSPWAVAVLSPGVAPEALLYSFKVFGRRGTTSLVPLALNAALLGAEALPRGGTVRLAGDPGRGLLVCPEGRDAAWPAGLLGLLCGHPVEAALQEGPRRVVAPLLAGLVAQAGWAMSLAHGAGDGAAPLLLGPA